MDKVTPINNKNNTLSPTSNTENILNNDNGGKSATTEKKSPSKSFMFICGTIISLIFLPLTILIGSAGITPWIPFLGLIGILFLVRNRNFSSGVILGFLLLPLLFFGSCLLLWH
jgi:hypothetical protein